MKQIYFVITNTGTVLSKIVTHFMKDEYSHVSISLDKDLNNMYSFGRLNPYNPFYGGFIHEFVDKGTFKRFKKTKSIVFGLNINKDQFDEIKEQIEYFDKNKRIFKFNVIGLFAVYFNKKRRKENYFYCAEFIKYILKKSDIELDLPELVRPQHFVSLNGTKLIYKGLLKEYPRKAGKSAENVL